MLRVEKHEFVTKLEAIYTNSSSVIVTHYHGLSVAQITSLRNALRAQGAGFKVIKNTLSKIAADNSGLSKIATILNGPTAIAYANDPVTAAKVVVEFSKTNEQLQIVGGVIDNELLNSAQVLQIAKLPSLNELRGKMIGVLQAPATKLATILQVPAAGLARILQAYASKS